MTGKEKINEDVEKFKKSKRSAKERALKMMKGACKECGKKDCEC